MIRVVARCDKNRASSIIFRAGDKRDLAQDGGYPRSTLFRTFLRGGGEETLTLRLTWQRCEGARLKQYGRHMQPGSRFPAIDRSALSTNTTINLSRPLIDRDTGFLRKLPLMNWRLLRQSAEKFQRVCQKRRCMLFLVAALSAKPRLGGFSFPHATYESGLLLELGES
jgi:hypothetical protein